MHNGAARRGTARRGQVRQGAAWRGGVWFGMSWRDSAWLGTAWLGGAGLGVAWHGEARQGFFQGLNMSEIDTGGQAFPKSGFYTQDGPSSNDSEDADGMTLLDRFAEALIPYATAIVMERVRIAMAQGDPMAYTPRELAEFCYGHAKAFIAEKRRLEDQP